MQAVSTHRPTYVALGSFLYAVTSPAVPRTLTCPVAQGAERVETVRGWSNEAPVRRLKKTTQEVFTAVRLNGPKLDNLVTGHQSTHRNPYISSFANAYLGAWRP